ncbi:UDP-N-acetylglucosamine 2-epimerase [Candidatus Koribacter versatilis Ellin345]|uniref:UDP-N-acetylglucosamine 2-epimerase n=1 Tax=Koribacter versatilis (strain Ellin345) TaxID=204669 RepID=Q1ISX2_KORVE|nr:UDP-N-acetylglucosamine 2-epimerase (non-hydrolyzing) [Candidatus Koribacter versatilis]ABF40028.1 UDP-N-acetylglucosamine 2-epimerase [Candidatus Koribacter versatilis Ellin345]
MHFLHVVGARPNFMKAAPLIRALEQRGSRQTLVHSGQHYDRNMSTVFFDQLGIRKPDVNLQVGSGSHAQQTAAIMSRVEPVLLNQRPDAVIVYGDINSTVAVALVCAKLGIKLIHVEAGLRSFDRSMPEEINRLVTDQLADVLFTPSLDGDENLHREGIPDNKVHFVGNIMIDTLVRLLPLAELRFADLAAKFNLIKFGLVTLHRPSNVDDISHLAPLLFALDRIAEDLPLLFPVHPRTLQHMQEFSINLHHLQILEPLPYIDFLSLQQRAALVITDSGGIQEETTYLGIPCLTVRENTERPVTVTLGTNLLVGSDFHRMESEARKVIAGNKKCGSIPPLWDGHTSDRIASILINCGSFPGDPNDVKNSHSLLVDASVSA